VQFVLLQDLKGQERLTMVHGFFKNVMVVSYQLDVRNWEQHIIC